MSARLFLSAVLVVATVSVGFKAETAHAAQITNRNLVLESQGATGGSMPGGTVGHRFNFTIATTNDIGSIKFEYCTIASGTCTTPDGLDTSGATIGAQTGATGFVNITKPANGTVYISRASAASIASTTNVSYLISSVINPTTANETFFVRISTFASLDTTGTAIDTGTVTASTANALVLSGVMPESLIFCTAETITAPAGVPDCSSATDGTIAFNQLFSPTDTATATSQMAASTNATTGYIITVNGTTLTSGSNTIAGAGAAATTSTRGTAQFGLNLRANATPAVGTNVAPAADAANYRGQPATQYDTPDSFSFANGATVANSENGNTPGVGSPTNAQIFTVSYIVNVPGNQPAGTYTSTLTYVCTATF